MHLHEDKGLQNDIHSCGGGLRLATTSIIMLEYNKEFLCRDTKIRKFWCHAFSHFYNINNNISILHIDKEPQYNLGARVNFTL